MRLYRLKQGIVAEESGRAGLLREDDWDALFNRRNLESYLAGALRRSRPLKFDLARAAVLAPIGSQEVWAAGVTYYRSRDARMEESKSAGGGDFYERVYAAARPELFMKATPHRVVGPNRKVAIRDDAKWSVPEPELTLLITPSGKITG